MEKPNSLMDVIASNIRTLRKARGLSQEDLADMCDLHRTYIGSVERGERNITINSLETIAKALSVDPTELLQK